MVFPETLKLQRLSDKLAAMTELKQQEEAYKPQEERETLVVAMNKKDPVWERLREEISMFVPEVNYIGSADLIRSVYTAGVKDVQVLKSLAALSLTKSKEGQQNYETHILTLAQFLSLCSPVPVRRSSKVALIRTLMTLRSPLEVGWQLQEVVIEDTLRFITEREYIWEYLDHFDEVLLWEIRACTLNEIEKRSDRVVGFISQQAVSIRRGLGLSADVVNAGIEGAGARLKEVLEPDDQSLFDESHEPIVAYSEKAKQATDSVRLSSRQAVVKIQSASSRGIHTIANRIQEGAPNESSRKALCTVGKVGAASVGAAALISDSLIESTAAVTAKTAAVTAEVVEHKYGSQAGKLIRNASDTAGNIARTLAHVGLLHKSRAMTKSVAKATGKAHLRAITINDQSLLDECGVETYSDEGEMFARAEDDLFNDEIKEVQLTESQETSCNTTEDEEESTKEASGVVEQVLSTAPRNDVFVLQDNSNGKGNVNNLAPEFDFDTTMTMSPSELDSCLPDQITSIDAQSDFFSDVTNEPFYEKTRGYSKLLYPGESTRNSIFRNVLNESSSPLEKHISYEKPQAKGLLPEKDDDESLGFTACTMDLTNSTFHDQRDSTCILQHQQEHPFDLDNDEDNGSHVSGFEKHYEAWATGSEVGTEIPEQEQKDNVYQSNCIPPNGYVLSEGGGKPETWPKELYSNVKSKFGL